MEWGKIPQADLEMKVYPPDTSASAVVLGDYGESFLTDNFDIEFRRHLRVKVLNSRGYDFATHAVTINDKNERVTDIEGVTYTLETGGKIRETEMKKDGIFKEDIDGVHTRYRFTLPGLSPGCVIEIAYRIKAQSLWWARDWVFQTSEPTRWSEYRMRSPRQIAYSAVVHGYEPFTINENTEVVQQFDGEAYAYLGEHLAKCNQMRWAVKDAPAIRDEPFITTTEDYFNKVDLQLLGYAFIGGGKKTFLSTWPDLISELLDESDFGEYPDATSAIRDQARQLTDGLTSPEEKIKAIYNWVARSIVWTGQNRLYASNSLKEVFNTKKGTSAEVAFLMLAMLRSVGIEGDPIILSTRGNGQIQRVYPILSQFNYVIIRARTSAGTMLLDPTDRLRPWDLLPTKVLNVQGLVVQPDKEEWLTITSPHYAIDSLKGLLELSEDGSIHGTLSGAYREYAALFARRDAGDVSTLQLARKLLGADDVGLTVDSASVEGQDSLHHPLSITATVSGANYAQSTGDLMYVNPHLLAPLKENPLKHSMRKFPIDYSYLRKKHANVRLVLPQGYEVKEPVPDRTVQLSGSDVLFTRSMRVDGSTVMLNYAFAINKLQFDPRDYAKLRQFYGLVVQLQSEPIVLQRK